MANAFLVRPLAPAAVTATGTVLAGQPDYAFNDYAGVTIALAMNVAGLGSGHAALTIDLGQDTPLDTIMVFGLALAPTSTTFAAAYATAAQGNFTGASTAIPEVPAYAGATMPVSGRGVTLLALDAPVTARYLRLFYIAASAGQSVRIARVAVGARTRFARNFGYGAGFGVRDLGTSDVTRRGVPLRTRGAKLRTVQLTFASLYKDEVVAQVRPLLELVGNTEPVALVTDPAEDADRQNCCYFGPLVGDLGTIWKNAVGYEAKVNLVSWI